jgi:hypothetical protein
MSKNINNLRAQNILRSFWSSVCVPTPREHHKKTNGPMKATIKVGDVGQLLLREYY